MAAAFINSVSFEAVDLKGKDVIVPQCEMHDNIHEYVAEVGVEKRTRVACAEVGATGSGSQSWRRSYLLARDWRCRGRARCGCWGTPPRPPRATSAAPGWWLKGEGGSACTRGAAGIWSPGYWIAMHRGDCPWKT